MNQQRCEKCGEFWWDSHVCPKQLKGQAMKVQTTYDNTLYQLVPKEPTVEMKIAGDNAGWWCADKYRAMLSDAPTTPAQPEERMPHPYLANGTRYKVAMLRGGSGSIMGLPEELCGRWVALVAADDDCHLDGIKVESSMQGIRCPNANDEQCRYPDCKCHG